MAVWSIVSLKALSRTFRLDAEYYQPRYLQNIDLLTKCSHCPVKTFDQLLLSISGGATPSGADYPDEGVPFLRVQNIMPGYTNMDDVVYISEATHKTELARSRLKAGDVLLTITGVSYGKAAYVPIGFGEANINQHSVRMAFNRELLPEYVATYLNSTFGKLQSDMKITGVTRPALDYGEIRSMLIPVLPLHLQEHIKKIVSASEHQRQQSNALYAEAENLLLHELHLDTLDLSHQLTCERNFSELHDAQRYDSDYFQPKYQNAMAIMGASGQCIQDVAHLAKRPFQGTTQETKARITEGTFKYIEIGNLGADGNANSETVAIAEAPSRAQWVVCEGDVITSTVRPIRRLSALIEPEQEGMVCSSGFAVLKPYAIEPEVLLLYLRLPIVCEILDLYATASMYPAISTSNLLNIPITLPDKQTRHEIVSKVQAAKQAREDAKQLLETAKKRVEEMILSQE